MADKTGKEPYSDADALEELYASALSDISEDELSDFDMGDIPIEDILEVADNVEPPSLDAYSDAIDTKELDELLEKENNTLVVEGAIDSGFNVEDIDWDNMSLDDLMADDEETETEDDFAEESDDDKEEMPEEEQITEDEQVTEDEVISEENNSEDEFDALSNLFSETVDDIQEENEAPKTNEKVYTIPDDEISISLEGLSDDFEELDKSEEISDIIPEDDIMSLLTNDGSEELEEIEDDEFETLEDDELELFDDLQELQVNINNKKGDKKQKTYVEVNTKNLNTDNVFEEALSVLSDDMDESEVAVDDVEALLDTVKDNSKSNKKKGGKGLGSLFANIVDEKEIQKVEKEKKAAEQAEIDKQKKAELKKVNAEKKAQKKEEKKLESARKAEEKRAKKAAKKRARQEAKEIRELEEETEIEGRINKVGAFIVLLVMGCMGLAIFFGAKMFSYNNSISNARQYFENGQYEESYNELVGLDLKEEDKLLYEKVVTIMQVYKQLDAYEMYYKEGRYPQALDALLKGVREYEKNIAKATELDITANMDELKAKIVHELTVEYGITEEVAREVNQITDSKVYSMRVYELAKELASDYY